MSPHWASLLKICAERPRNSPALRLRTLTCSHGDAAAATTGFFPTRPVRCALLCSALDPPVGHPAASDATRLAPGPLVPPSCPGDLPGASTRPGAGAGPVSPRRLSGPYTPSGLRAPGSWAAGRPVGLGGCGHLAVA